MNNETVMYKQDPVAPAKTFVNRDASQTRLIVGVSVPDSPLITAVIEHAQQLSEPYLFNHAMRSWLFAEAIGRIKGLDYDREVVAIGTILHDIGLTDSVSGPNRFEVNGADAALSFIKGRGLSDRQAQLIWDLVALNSTPSLALHKEPEVAVGTMGIGLGFSIQVLHAPLVLQQDCDNPSHLVTQRTGACETGMTQTGSHLVVFYDRAAPRNVTKDRYSQIIPPELSQVEDGVGLALRGPIPSAAILHCHERGNDDDVHLRE